MEKIKSCVCSCKSSSSNKDVPVISYMECLVVVVSNEVGQECTQCINWKAFSNHQEFWDTDTTGILFGIEKLSWVPSKAGSFVVTKLARTVKREIPYKRMCLSKDFDNRNMQSSWSLSGRLSSPQVLEENQHILKLYFSGNKCLQDASVNEKAAISQHFFFLIWKNSNNFMF